MPWTGSGWNGKKSFPKSGLKSRGKSDLYRIKRTSSHEDRRFFYLKIFCDLISVSLELVGWIAGEVSDDAVGMI